MGKAYYVYVPDQDDEYSDLVMADSPAKAKKRALFYGDVDWTEIRVKRVPKLDNELTPFSDKAIFEAGFCVPCAQCHREYIDSPIFSREGFAFCDEVCRSKWQSYWNRRK